MTPALIVAVLLVLAVVTASVRLILRQRRAETRSPVWRLAVLLILQPVCAGLLYLTLFPPVATTGTGTLVVATGKARIADTMGGHVIALPEAPASGAERMPDLATALRKYPDAMNLHIVGEGLEARDREATIGRTVSFEAAPLPQGVVRLDVPPAVAPGTTFHITGRVNGLTGTAELVDPAGHRVDTVALPDKGSGEFSLSGAARMAGPAIFKLQVRDAQRRLLQESDVPVWTSQDLAPRVLIVAGAPGPDVKYLRRWAEDAGMAVHVQFTLGGGIDINDASLPISAATLHNLDLVILDERSWAALSDGERGALIVAMRDGLGVLLRVTGPVPDATRRQWADLGLAVSPVSTDLQLPLQTVDDDAVTARRGPGSPGQPSVLNAGADTPDLTALAKVEGGDAVPLAQDKSGKALGVWRLEGRGRIAVWTVSDAYGLVLSGQGDRYGDLWSQVVTTLARPRQADLPQTEGWARQFQRVTMCGLVDGATVLTPEGNTLALRLDPASGDRACAAFWPAQSGWHVVRTPTGAACPVYVLPQDALDGVQAMESREATQRLVSGGRVSSGSGLGATPAWTGTAWIWFMLWLASAAGLWWLERRRPARFRT
ncbi:MAG: hypothetical protein QM647_08250 [Asticcacaulis sp.]|uniref:hypothetical protein n=1 Tax=Asticcacaulis sp. TaxID=1872648 RepID=UPI0039E2DE17